MAIEDTLTALLTPLVAELHWDVLPEGYIMPDDHPIVICQQVGGDAGWYVEDVMPDDLHARIQIEVWSKRRLQANQTARLIEKTIAEAHLTAQPYGAFANDYEQSLKLHGTRQQFGFWFKNV